MFCRFRFSYWRGVVSRMSSRSSMTMCRPTLKFRYQLAHTSGGTFCRFSFSGATPSAAHS